MGSLLALTAKEWRSHVAAGFSPCRYPHLFGAIARFPVAELGRVPTRTCWPSSMVSISPSVKPVFRKSSDFRY